MKNVFLLFFVLLLFGMIGSVSCNDSDAEIEPGDGAPAPVPQTGQTMCWDTDGNVINCAGTGQDGDIQAGVVLPDPRFTDNGDGTVTDNLTGLIWLKNANCFSQLSFEQALTNANTLEDPACGLSDGSVAGDWHLVNLKELTSLVQLGTRSSPTISVLPQPNPFVNLEGQVFWTSTSVDQDPRFAWFVDMIDGSAEQLEKVGGNVQMWAVRTPQ